MARRKKKRDAPKGAPDWIVTYGDMMTLLLCFFVMIVAMSEIKKDERFQKVVASFQKVFGYRGGIGVVPTEIPADVSPRQRKNATMAENIDLKVGTSPEESLVARNKAVKTIRDGTRYTVGAPITFAQGRAELSDEARLQLMKVANKIRGLRLTLEVRGHASKTPLAADSPYRDHMDLAAKRSRVVLDWLTSAAADRGRLDPQRIRLVACGTNEPRSSPAYDASDRAKNDRVEIIQTEALVREFQGPTASADGEYVSAGL